MRTGLLLIGTVVQLLMIQPVFAEDATAGNELPGECKTFQSAKLENCIAVHKASEDCTTASDANRIKCAKDKIGLTVEPAQAIKKCSDQVGMERKACEAAVKNKIISSVTFSFDDLAVKAENAKKIKSDRTNKFVAGIELSKEKFNLAKTYSERVKIVQKVKIDWSKFVKANKGKITTKNNLDKALKDLRAAK